MVGETRKFFLRTAVVAARQDNPQNATSAHGIFPKRLVKVAYSKEEHGAWVFRLYLVVLTVEGCFFDFNGFGCVFCSAGHA